VSDPYERARRTLVGYHSDEPRQVELRTDFLAVLDSHRDALNRSCRPDHLTASAVVLSSDARYVLLDLHRKVGRWLQFGGHAEPGDHDLGATGLREAREESGIDAVTLVPGGPARLDRHPAPCAPGLARDHLDVQYVALAPRTAEPRVSAESHDVRWFAVARLPEPTDDSVRALVTAAVARVGQQPD
jgi:8-oxo-dGTP pyrophosphatase MutT (NUDIX family)